jgi:membrane fusion protein, hemolysin D
VNALIKFPVQRKSALPAVIKARAAPVDHLEFLPANLELLETPASPRASVFLWLLCGLLAAALGWSWFAHLDIHAVAQGRIQPNGRSKVVQPLDPGVVSSINVVNGATVRAGDILVELDPTDSLADRDTLTGQLEWLEAEVVRRTKAIDAVRNKNDTPNIVFPSTVSEPIQLQERNGLLADISQYVADRESLNAQRGQLEATKQRLTMSIDARDKLIASLRERVDMKEKLVALQSGTRSAVIDALQTLQSEETNSAYDKGQLIETQASVTSNLKKIEQLTEQFISKQTQALLDAQRKHSDVSQSLIKARAKTARTRLVAPIDGTVQQLLVTTIGQVVTTGQPLMVIVPLEAKLEVEALIQNQDIAFVKPGQDVIVKVNSFPFTRYGTIEGTVRRVSSDSVDQRDAGLSSDTGNQRGGNANAVSGVTPVQNLVYPVVIELSRFSIYADGRDVPLGPGMMVTAEVRTGSRRVIDYLLAPLREIASQAGRER